VSIRSFEPFTIAQVRRPVKDGDGDITGSRDGDKSKEQIVGSRQQAVEDASAARPAVGRDSAPVGPRNVATGCAALHPWLHSAAPMGPNSFPRLVLPQMRLQLPAAGCLLSTAHCPLSTAHCPLFPDVPSRLGKPGTLGHSTAGFVLTPARLRGMVSRPSGVRRGAWGTEGREFLADNKTISLGFVDSGKLGACVRP
jgi:hypothetical protein